MFRLHGTLSVNAKGSVGEGVQPIIKFRSFCNWTRGNGLVKISLQLSAEGTFWTLSQPALIWSRKMMPFDAKMSGAGSMFVAVVGEHNIDSVVFKNNWFAEWSQTSGFATAERRQNWTGSVGSFVGSGPKTRKLTSFLLFDRLSWTSKIMFVKVWIGVDKNWGL